jgi:hypothetical protein
MQKTILVLAGLALLGGCGKENSAGNPAEAARDVAMVERMSKEPFKPVLPVVITEMDIERYGLDKPGCSFRKGTQTDPLFIAGKDEAFMRVGADLKRFSAKDVSAELSGGARSTYVGLAGWVDLMRLPDGGTGSDDLHWPARLVVHDAQERVAYQADGSMTCRG